MRGLYRPALLVLLLLAAIAGTGSRGAASRSVLARPRLAAAVAQATSTTADDLARRILAGGDDGVAATAEALARAGIASIRPDGAVQPPVEPSLPMTMPAYQVSSLASDAAVRTRGRYHLTLADVGAGLVQDDWTLPAGTNPGTVLAKVLRAAVLAGQQQPSDPQSFVPLLLAALAKATPESVDLAGADVDPAGVHWSLLEAQLFISANLRGNASYPALPASPQPPAGAGPGDAAARFFSLAAPGTVAAAAPCSDFEDNLGAFKQVHLVSLDALSGFPMDKFYDIAGFSAAGKFGMSHIMNVFMLIATFTTPNFTVTADPAEQHYSHDGQENTATFTAKVMIPAADAAFSGNSTVQAIQDCLGTLGVGVSPLDGSSNWKVSWDWSGLGKHATIGEFGKENRPLDFNAPPAYRLGESGQAQLVVDMTEEKPGAHATGLLRHGTASVSGKLDTSGMDATPFIKAAIPGGLPDALYSVLADLFKSWFGPTSTAQLAVTWHDPASYQLVFDSSIVTSGRGAALTSSHTHATAPLHQGTGTTGLTGTAPLEYLAFTPQLLPGCTNTGITFHGGTFNVSSLTLNLPLEGSSAGPTIIAVLDPGIAVESWTAHCPDLTLPAVTSSFFSGLFAVLHQDERAGSTYAITNWVAGSGDVVARKSYQRIFVQADSPDVTVTETTTIELRRLPSGQ